jgi:hypothetical protein
MKVAPDLSGVTALDTWLRGVDTDPAPADRTDALAPSTLSSTPATARDPAEDLLVLDVGAAHVSDSDPLAAGASAQDWAEHIFSPLR